MKKNYILILLMVTLSLSISSCSNDDDNNSIESTWEATHEGLIVDGVETLTPISNEGGCDKNTITFLNNGTYTETYSEFNDSKCVTFNGNGTWSKEGNSLTTKDAAYDDAEAVIAEISELNKSTLKLKYIHTDPQGKVVEIYVVVLQRK